MEELAAAKEAVETLEALLSDQECDIRERMPECLSRLRSLSNLISVIEVNVISALKSKQRQSEEQLPEQPANKKTKVCGKGGSACSGAAEGRIEIAPDFATGTCAEATWWAPTKVMPALGSFPIGHIKTCFPRKNGCPRQGAVCPSSLAHLDLCFGNNPQHALDGLEDFSHVWLIFLFNLNGTNYTPKAHIAPPRLKGKVKGVFATRRCVCVCVCVCVFV